MTDARARILFVDDEPAVLASLEARLRKHRRRWQMVFALGGQAALEACRKEAFDVVVSDMRMPDVDGVTLMRLLKDESPTTVQIMLSGEADPDTITRVVPSLHQFLSKPCDGATLLGAIERGIDEGHGCRRGDDA